MNRRLPAIIALLGLALAGLVGLVSIGGGGATVAGRQLHRIDLVANVTSIDADAGWSMDGGMTHGTIRLSLDDLRTFAIPDGTNAATYGDVPACADFTAPRACVLLADMLGQSVVWFALVPADTTTPGTFLTLPGIVDMQANGDEGILDNGWVLTLDTPTKRVCADADTSSLRDFITRFPASAARSIVDLTTDRIVRVECAK